MAFKTVLPATLSLMLAPALAMAQEAPRWTIGALGVASTSPFEAEAGSPRHEREVDITGFPYIAYRGDKFFIDGIGIGAHMAGGPASQSPLTADILVSARSRPGASRDRVTADAGVRLAYDSGFGTFQLAYMHDVTDTSNGSEITAGYGYTVRNGRWSLTPGLTLIRQSGGMADYLWGVTPKEHARNLAKGKAVLPVYAVASSVVNVEASLSASYSLGGNWSLLAFANVTRLDKPIRRNPGIDETYIGNMGIGAAYSF
jgi:outer membrane scaffolding protein for murein synthesis (MipA/OmpV family)